MDFGKVPESTLNDVNFQLPPDGARNQAILTNAGSAHPFNAYIGCAKWGRKEWVGLLYPPKTKEASFLDEYAKHFNSIELNAIFYGLPKPEQIESWVAKVSKNSDFKFCPKFTRSISHIKRLKNADEETDRFLNTINLFGKHLGPTFLQLSDNFGPTNFSILRNYLESLPTDLEVFVELRHESWFTDAGTRQELFDMLQKLNKGAVITDASGRRDCVHMELTIPKTFIRFVGNGLHPTDYSRIDEWIQRLATWKKQGLQDLHFYLHQHDEKDTPILADYFIKKFNEVCGLSLVRPHFVSVQSSIF